VVSASVVVPTYNRIARLKRVIAGLEAQQVPGAEFEVIAVSDGSTDGTDEYLRSLKPSFAVKALAQPNSGVAAARNLGLDAAEGDLVLFLDDDVVPSPALLAEHLRLHRCGDPKLVVLGPMLTPPDFKMAPWVRWEQAMLAKQYRAMIEGKWAPTARQFYTGNTSLRRELLAETGGFDPSFRRAEDVELAYRLVRRGARFAFNPDAVGWHYAERSFESWMKIPYQYGRCDVVFTRDRGNEWLLPTILYELRGRHPVSRMIVGACLDRPTAGWLAMVLLRGASQLGERAGIRAIPRFAYSGIFNLQYCQGIADELGGRDTFYSRMRNQTRPVGPPVTGREGDTTGSVTGDPTGHSGHQPHAGLDTGRD
jgi:GT2 family glycosyltransferase